MSSRRSRSGGIRSGMKWVQLFWWDAQSAMFQRLTTGGRRIRARAVADMRRHSSFSDVATAVERESKAWPHSACLAG